MATNRSWIDTESGQRREETDWVSDVLAWREQRYVGRDLALSYQRKRIILDDNDFVRSAAGRYVDTYEYPDGRFDATSRDISKLQNPTTIQNGCNIISVRCNGVIFRILVRFRQFSRC